MKVLHVIPAVAPRYGGPSAALPALCAALGRCGIDTTIAATDADGGGRLPVDVGVPTTYQGTRAIFFPRQFSESFKYSGPLAAWLSQNVRSFDLVHVHAVLSHACLAAGRACRDNAVPYIVRPLGTLDPWSLGQKAMKKRLLMWAAGRRLLANAAAIHYTSRQEKALVEESLGLIRGVVIPLGIDDSVLENHVDLRESPDHSRPYVLALSRLHPKKGLETLVAAFCALRADGRFGHWRLVIAGDGEPGYVERLKAAARQGDSGGSIEFAGWVEGQEKRSLLEHAALFAAPSFDENFGVSLAEALAWGVPAIVSRHGGLASDIEEAGAGWVAHVELSDLRILLEEAMQSPDERERRGQAARALARRFAWSSVAREVAELYGRVAGLKSCATIGH